MAVSAIHQLSTDIDVGLSEGSPLIIMTPAAQRLNGLHHQGRLLRKVRFVTCLAFLEIRDGMYVNLIFLACQGLFAVIS